MEEIRRRAVGYARVSSDSQSENTSIELQEEKIKEYCKLYNYELVEIFIDNGKTGSNTDQREAYITMMEFTADKGNRIDALVVLKADRIHRKLKNLLIMIEDNLQPNGVAFISITENFDTSTGQGTLFFQMMGSFAEFERGIINERTKSGRVKTALNKQYAGGGPPYGYRAVNNELIVDEFAAGVVKRIFSEYAQGDSMSRIATNLNKNRIANRKGRVDWSRQIINYMLRNSIYIGIYSYDGKIEKNGIQNKGQVQPIISKRLWNRVQKQLPSSKRQR